MSDDEPDKAPMTIKAVPVATRKKMAACATKRGETMAEWLARAVDTQAERDAGEVVIPPGQPDKPAALARALVTVETADLAALLQAVAAVGTAAGLPAGVAREAYAAARIRLREARGLPGKPARKTKPPNGQTIDGEAG